MLWKRVAVPEGGSSGSGAGGPAVEDASAQPQFVIEDDEDSDEDEDASPRQRAPKSPPTPAQAPEKPRETMPSVAERLFSCLIDLMFCCGFTLPTKIQVDHYKINYVIWYVVQVVYNMVYCDV